LNNSSVVTVDMDFSNFNSAEQAHMTKVIEKRQVSTFLSTYPQPTSQIYRCKTSSKCIPTSSRNASTLAVTTSQARPCHQKRSFIHFLLCRMYVYLSPGAMRLQLRRKVLKTYRESRGSVCGTKCRCVF
jgi:hypothetical protein